MLGLTVVQNDWPPSQHQQQGPSTHRMLMYVALHLGCLESSWKDMKTPSHKDCKSRGEPSCAHERTRPPSVGILLQTLSLAGKGRQDHCRLAYMTQGRGVVVDVVPAVPNIQQF